MSELISESRPVSRKDRNCMASEWILNCGFDQLGLTFAERRQIVIARRNGWQIKAGEQYVKQATKCCGDFGVFIAIPAMHDICLKYEMYEEC
jgi:hypothetical protein